MSTSQAGRVVAPSSQSPPSLRAPVALRSPLHVVRVATFNVRGLTAEYKKQALSRDLAARLVDICALQETKIQEDLDRPLPNNTRLICFKPHTPARGNGFFIGKKFAPFLHRAWQHELTERIAVAIFHLPLSRASRFYELRIINVYGPTSPISAKDPSERDRMYDLLAKQVAVFNNNRGCTIVIGDFNARVGRQQDGETCIGSHGRGLRNENGDALSTFAEANSFLLANTCFMHPMTHRTTWRGTSSMGKKLFNTIDFVLIPQTMRPSLRQARSWSGLETFSDHALVIATLDLRHLRIQWARKRTSRWRLCIEKLDNKRQAFTDHVGRTWALRAKDELRSPQQQVDALKDSLLNAAEEVLGRTERKGPHFDPIAELSSKQKSLRIQMDVKCSSEKRADLRRQRNELLRQIHKLSREQALKVIDSQVAEIEKAKDNTQVFLAVKQVRRWRSSRPIVHDRERHVIRDPSEAAGVIAKHFEHAFNPPDDTAVRALSSFDGPPRPLQQPITVEETKKAVMALKNGKAPGPDLLPVELLKATAPISAQIITSALNEAIQKQLPLELGEGTLIPIPKLNKPRGPVANLRPIFLLTAVRKVFVRIVLQRVRENFERKLPLHQAAYRSGRSTSDGVWVQRMCVSMVENFKMKIHKLGTDLSHAFDSVDRDKLIKLLAEDGWTNDDENRMIRMLLTNTNLTVRFEWKLSEKLRTTIGVPQGDGLSGLLFIVFLSTAMRDVERKMLLSTPSRPQTDVLLGLPHTSSYADDVDYYSTQKDYLEVKLHVAEEVYPIWNLELNVAKTERVEWFLFPTKNECRRCEKICTKNAAMCDKCESWWHYLCVPLSEQQIKSFEADPGATFVCPKCEEGSKNGNRGDEEWRNAKHLGSFLDSDKDVNCRIANANAAFATLGKVWRRDVVKTKKRLLLFKAFVQPHFLYNLGVQGMNQTLESRLDTAQRKLLRRTLGIFYPNKISNAKLYKTTGIEPLSTVARKTRWRLFGHLLRQDPTTPANLATCAFFKAKQMFQSRAGTKRTCLMETLKKDLKRIEHLRGLQLNNEDDLKVLRELAAEREQWRALCYDITCFES